MKKKIIATLAIFALFALAVAAYAYTQTNTVAADKACCCKSADSCPMKADGHDEKGEHAQMACCEKHQGEHAKADGQACSCCGDSCPMKKDGAATTATDGKSCCENCDCCKGKKDIAV